MSDLFRYAQLQPYALAGSGAITGATSITLKAMADIDGNPLSMSGTFGDIGFGTLQPGSGDQEEQISFTGLVNNANGTTTLTGVSNVSFLYPYTQTSGLAKTHPGSSVFVISNTSGFYDKLTSKNDDETIAGKWTFTTVPATTEDPVAGDDIARRSWVLSVVNGGPVSTSSVIINGVAGETLVAGDLIYLKDSSTAGQWYKTDADTSTTVLSTVLGIAQGAGSAGVAISAGILLKGVDAVHSGLTAGATYYASNTAGGISVSAGTTPRTIGKANAAGLLIFDPYFDQTLTKGQFDALVGSSGTPSSTNKFVTESAISNSVISAEYDQTQTTQNSSVEVGEANATSKKNKLAQSFVAGWTSIRGVKLYKSADTGTFTGTVTVSLQADTAGAPSGSAIATVTITNAQWLLINTGEFTANFTAEYESLVVGTTYWIVVQTSTSDNSNHINVGDNTAGGYGSGGVKYNNTTDGWVLIPTIDLYFKTIRGVVSKYVVTGTDGYIISPILQYQFIDLNTTDTTTVSTNETTTYSRVLPIGFFTSNGGIRIKSWGTIDPGGSGGYELKVYLNGTQIYDATGTSADGPEATFFHEAYIINASSTSSQKYAYNWTGIKGFITSGTSIPSGGTTIFLINGDGTSAIDTSAATSLTVTLTMGSGTATQTALVLERIG